MDITVLENRDATEKIFIVNLNYQYMKRVFSLVIICITFCFIMGCCNPPPVRPQSENPQSSQSYYNGSSIRTNIGSSIHTIPLIPSRIEIAWKPKPTETIPSMYEVQIETYKNPLGSDPYISTTFRGGSGQVYTQSMDALVLRSDNIIEFESIPYPQVGSQIIMNGTTGTDRLVVYIVLSNERYRVVDELLPLKSYS
jgi:hypothetical protein